MNLVEVLSTAGTNTMLIVSANDLKEAFNMFAKEREIVEAETMLTLEKVCEIFGKNRSTLWAWSKRGYLVPERLGKQVFYKQSEVNRLMNGRISK